MKKLSLGILSLALFIASCDKAAETAETTEAKKEKPVRPSNATQAGGDLKVAYVNTDSLFEQYQLLKDLEDQFVAEKLTMENKFRDKVNKLEQDYRDAEAGASQLSQEALQILGMKLQQREQALMEEKQAMEEELYKSEQEKNDQLFDDLRTFLDDYARNEGYHMIYGYNGYGNVLYMDDQFNITNIVVDSLNIAYNKKKEAQTASK